MKLKCIDYSEKQEKLRAKEHSVRLSMALLLVYLLPQKTFSLSIELDLDELFRRAVLIPIIHSSVALAASLISFDRIRDDSMLDIKAY